MLHGDTPVYVQTPSHVRCVPLAQIANTDFGEIQIWNGFCWEHVQIQKTEHPVEAVELELATGETIKCAAARDWTTWDGTVSESKHLADTSLVCLQLPSTEQKLPKERHSTAWLSGLFSASGNKKSATPQDRCCDKTKRRSIFTAPKLSGMSTSRYGTQTQTRLTYFNMLRILRCSFSLLAGLTDTDKTPDGCVTPSPASSTKKTNRFSDA